jgi:hypothetical protein
VNVVAFVYDHWFLTMGFLFWSGFWLRGFSFALKVGGK